MKWSESHSVMSNSLQLQYGLCSPWNSPGQNTGVGSLFFLQGIFPTQESYSGLPHCRQILYQLSYKGSLRILEWVACPFSTDLPDPGIKLRSLALLVYSLPTELSEKPWLKRLKILRANINMKIIFDRKQINFRKYLLFILIII